MTEGIEAPGVLVLCVGNRMRRDDGFGPLVADRLNGMGVSGMAVQEHVGEGAELMDAWSGASHVILVDAAQSGAAPGTLHRFNAAERELPKSFFRYSSHQFGVAEAVETARALGDLPPRMTVIAVEGEAFNAGEGLTTPVAARLDEVVAEIVSDIEVK